MSDAIDHRVLAEEVADVHARPHQRETDEADLLYGILCGLLAIHDALTAQPKFELNPTPLSPEQQAALVEQFERATRAGGRVGRILPPDGEP